MPKGVSGNPAGRPVGKPNKATSLAREAIARFVDANVERLSEWLDEIALDSPKDAFKCFMEVCEYHVPKLGRIEHTGLDGEAIKTEVTMSDEILEELTIEQLSRIRAKASEKDDIGTTEGSA